MFIIMMPTGGLVEEYALRRRCLRPSVEAAAWSAVWFVSIRYVELHARATPGWGGGCRLAGFITKPRCAGEMNTPKFNRYIYYLLEYIYNHVHSFRLCEFPRGIDP